MKKILTMVLAAMWIFSLAGAASAQYKATMKLASVTPVDHFYNVGARKFAELIKERTQGRIEIKVYPAGQLGKGEREITEAVQQGAVELLITSTGPMGGFSPSINILDFPFLFRDFSHVDLVMDGPIGRKLLNDFEKAEIKALAFWENGFRHLTNNKRPVKKVEDGKGLKIRTMENKVHLAAWKAAGYNPTPMSWGEVYTALQQGVIDGQENPIAIIASNKLWEAGQKNFSFTAHVYSPAPLIMSKKKFDGMPREDQDLFLKTALEVAKFQRKLNRDAEASKIKEMESKGMVVVRDVDKASFMAGAEASYKKSEDKIPKELVEKVRNTK